MESTNNAMKRIQSQALIGKFRSKEDLQRILGKASWIVLANTGGNQNLIFKALLSEEKKAFKSNEIRMIEIPNFPEISVTNLYDDAMSDPDVTIYLPQKLQLSNELPRRNFSLVSLELLNLSTQMKLYMKLIRNTIASLLKKEKQGIQISDTWLQELQKHPFITKKPGTAISLMKERSKLNRERQSQVKHELSKRLFKDLQKPEEMDIDAGAGTKRRNIGPSKPQEEEKKEKQNPFTGQFKKRTYSFVQIQNLLYTKFLPSLAHTLAFSSLTLLAALLIKSTVSIFRSCIK